MQIGVVDRALGLVVALLAESYGARNLSPRLNGYISAGATYGVNTAFFGSVLVAKPSHDSTLN